MHLQLSQEVLHKLKNRCPSNFKLNMFKIEKQKNKILEDFGQESLIFKKILALKQKQQQQQLIYNQNQQQQQQQQDFTQQQLDQQLKEQQVSSLISKHYTKKYMLPFCFNPKRQVPVKSNQSLTCNSSIFSNLSNSRIQQVVQQQQEKQETQTNLINNLFQKNQPKQKLLIANNNNDQINKAKQSIRALLKQSPREFKQKQQQNIQTITKKVGQDDNLQITTNQPNQQVLQENKLQLQQENIENIKMVQQNINEDTLKQHLAHKKDSKEIKKKENVIKKIAGKKSNPSSYYVRNTYSQLGCPNFNQKNIYILMSDSSDHLDHSSFVSFKEIVNELDSTQKFKDMVVLNKKQFDNNNNSQIGNKNQSITVSTNQSKITTKVLEMR